MEQQKGLTGSTLKIIAMVTMLIDHIGASILERGVMPKAADGSVMDAGVEAMKVYNRWKVVDMACRGIGRIAFPIFCFLLVEGFLHTGNWKKYFSRLFLFSLISEVPFDLAVFKSWYDFSSQNVFFTLWIALLVLAVMKYAGEKQEWSEALQLLAQIAVAAVGMGVAHLLHTDYAAFGVLAIAELYFLRKDRKRQVLCGCVLFLWEITAPLAFLPIYHYNGKRGINVKYIFYFFYPVHLLIFGLIIKFAF